MTITPFQMYLIFKLDDLRAILGDFMIPFGIMWAFCLIGLIICIIGGATADTDSDAQKSFSTLVTKLRNIFLCTIIIWMAFGIIKVALPTTKQMAVILVVPAIVNSDFIQKDIPAELRSLYALAKKSMEESMKGEESPDQSGPEENNITD